MTAYEWSGNVSLGSGTLHDFQERVHTANAERLSHNLLYFISPFLAVTLKAFQATSECKLHCGGKFHTLTAYTALGEVIFEVIHCNQRLLEQLLDIFLVKPGR